MKNSEVFVVSTIVTVLIAWLPVLIYPEVWEEISLPLYVCGVGIGLGCFACSFIKKDLKLRNILFVTIFILASGSILFVNRILFGSISPHVVICEPATIVANKNPFHAEEFTLYSRYGKLLLQKTADEEVTFGKFNGEVVFVKLKKLDQFDKMKQQRRYSIIDFDGKCLKDTVWRSPFYNSALDYWEDSCYIANLHFRADNNVIIAPGFY